MLKVPPARIVFPQAARARVLRMIDEALSTGALTLGRYTQQLEEEFAARHGSRYAVAVSSGTAALEIIFRGLDLGGEEVVVPANTFFATAAAVMHAGGRVRLADVDEETLALSRRSVEEALTPDTAAVVMVHIGGMISPEADAIARLCRMRGVELIEDAAHAHGSSLHGRSAGTWGTAAAFSFYPTKVLTAGEGGMILTDDVGLRDEARIYRDQGKAGFVGGEHVRLGAAWRMSEVHAAIALTHLELLDEMLACRHAVAELYDATLARSRWVTPVIPAAGSESNYYKYPAFLAPGIERRLVKERMLARGVGLSGEVYARPLHQEPVFASVPHGDLSVAEDVCARHICLPVHSDMTETEATYVLSSLEDVLADLAPAAEVTR